MNAVVPVAERPARSVLVDMASRFGMEPAAFEATVRATCMPGQNVTREHFAAFLLVAKEYGLNPLTKELYAFPAKGGGIQPIVSIDGWMNMINAHPQFDGMEFDDVVEDANLVAVTCRIYRKDRSRATSVTEYMAECRRNTDVWRQWPARMLRHKAAIQCARYAFGFSGILEPDEYERMKDVTPAQPQSSGLASRLTGSRGPGFDHAQIERTVAGDETPAIEPAQEPAGEPVEADHAEQASGAPADPDPAPTGREHYDEGYSHGFAGRAALKRPPTWTEAQFGQYRDGYLAGKMDREEGDSHDA
jgi:phage recombination protein Bet